MRWCHSTRNKSSRSPPPAPEQQLVGPEEGVGQHVIALLRADHAPLRRSAQRPPLALSLGPASRRSSLALAERKRVGQKGAARKRGTLLLLLARAKRGTLLLLASAPFGFCSLLACGSFHRAFARTRKDSGAVKGDFGDHPFSILLLPHCILVLPLPLCFSALGFCFVPFVSFVVQFFFFLPPCSCVAVTVPAVPPRTAKSPITVIRRGSRTATKSSRIVFTTAS